MRAAKPLFILAPIPAQSRRLEFLPLSFSLSFPWLRRLSKYLRVPHPSRLSAKGGLLLSNATSPLFFHSFTLLLLYSYTFLSSLPGAPGTECVPGYWVPTDTSPNQVLEGLP